MRKFKRNGQSLVEFALILPILILLILGIAEGAHVIQSYLSAQNAVREAARYAVSGKPLNEYDELWAMSNGDRVDAIKNVAVDYSLGTGYTWVVTDTNEYATYKELDETCGANPCSGLLAVKVDAVKVTGGEDGQAELLQADHAGVEGSNVRVSLYHNVAIFDPIYAAIVPYLQIEASIVMRNEGGDSVTTDPEIPDVPEDPPGQGTGDGTDTEQGPKLTHAEEYALGDTATIVAERHDPGDYLIYVILPNGDEDYVGQVNIASAGSSASITYPLPYDFPLGLYTTESRELNQALEATNQFTVILGTQPLIRTGSETWPFGSVMPYDLFLHDPDTNYNITLWSTNPALEVDQLDPLTTGTDGNSTTQGLYLIPNKYNTPPSLTEGTYVVRSIPEGQSTSTATKTLQLVQGCILINQQTDCVPAVGDEVETPDGVYIYATLTNHGPNRSYKVILAKKNGDGSLSDVVEINSGIVTNENGRTINEIIYQLPIGLENGTYVLRSYDTANGEETDRTTIGETEFEVNTPDGPFIHVDGGYTWPAGTTINFQIRKHNADTYYDIYWEDQLVIDNSAGGTIDNPTDANEMAWFSYQIPITTPQGSYNLHSKLHGQNAIVATSLDIEVVPQPYLNIPEGMPQIPGAKVTVELHNHNINELYDVYVGGGDAANEPGIKLPDNPVPTDGIGSGDIPYDIAANALEAGDTVRVRSYPIGQTDQWVAELELSLIAADLQITKIEVPNPLPINGDVPITVTVINASEVTITHRSFDVDVYLDPSVEPNLGRSLPPGDYKTWLQPPLAYSETRTFTLTLPIYGATDHTIWARADTSNRIIEGDLENNNLKSLVIASEACEIEYSASIFNPDNVKLYGNANAIPTLRLNSSGISTWRSNDDAGNSGFFYTYRNVSGDFQMQARLATPNSNAAKWGFEVRASDIVTAAKVDWGYYINWSSLQYLNRPSTGTASDNENNKIFVDHPSTDPLWIRLERTGDTDTFTFYYATDNGDGTHGAWQTAPFNATNAMGTDVLAGLFSASYSTQAKDFDFNYFRICKAGTDCDDDANVIYEPTYDNTIDNGWTEHAFGDADDPTPTFTEVGSDDGQSVTVSGDTVTFNTSGSGTVEKDDDDNGYVYAYHQISGNFDVRVKASSQSNYEDDSNLDQWAKFGIEIREDVDDTTADKLYLATTASRKLQYLQRENGFESHTNDVGPSTHSLPVWLRIARNGNEFLLYYSYDNANPPAADSWVEIATQTFGDMSDNLYVGLFNSSYSVEKKNTITFDDYHMCGSPGGESSCGEVREASGLVVLNATNVTSEHAAWEVVSREGEVGRWVPEAGSNYPTPTGAPALQYGIDFTNLGTYQVWILGSRPDANGRGVHIGLDESSYVTMVSNQPDDTLAWFSGNSINVNSVGPATLNVWAYEDGFEIYQIILTTDANYNPASTSEPLGISQSQCSTGGTPEPPPGMLQCEAGIINGNFEDSQLMTEWTYPAVSQKVTWTSIPHYFAPGQSYSMLMPATSIAGLARTPWMYQDFQMPTWVITPTNNGGGTSVNLSMHVAVNPEGSSDPDPLYMHLRSQTGQAFDPVSVTGPITIATGADQPVMNPANPDPGNNEWILKNINLTDYFNPVNYEGQQLRFFLEAPNSGTASTRFYVDNISLDICTQQEVPNTYTTKVAGDVWVFLNGQPTPKPGIFVWIYAIDGSMEKTYTIHDSTFSFYDLPAEQGGTQYVLYAEYWQDNKLYAASTIIVLSPGQTIDDISLLLF